MKSIILISFIPLLLISSILKAQTSDTLTNEKILKLYKAGFGKDILKSKIQNSPTSFDVSIEGMLSLKKTGLPDEIINDMITKSSSDIAATVSASKTASIQNTEGVNLASGIYYIQEPGKYLEIEPSILTSSKTNGAAQLFVSGLINAKVKASLSGSQSSFSVSETSPKFLFVFDTTSKGSLNDDNNQWMNTARSPKEFLLVELEQEKKSRDITIGKSNIVKADFGINDKLVVAFSVTKLSNGVYEVAPEKPLVATEYCFMFAQGIRQGQSNKVFDFSVQTKKGF